MSTISSSPLANPYAFNFHSSSANKRQPNAGETFNVSNVRSHASQENIALQKTAGTRGLAPNLYGAAAANSAASSPNYDGIASNGFIDKDEMVQDKFKARLEENGYDIAEALEYARAETFKDIFAEELARNGGDAEAALRKASETMQLSEEEELAVLQDMAEKYEDNEEILEVVQEALARLDEEMRLEDAPVALKGDDSIDGSRNKNEIRDPLMYFFAQGKESIDDKNNKQSANSYETRFAGNMGANGGKPLNIIV